VPEGASQYKTFQKLNRNTQIKGIEPVLFFFFYYLLSLIGGKQFICL
jgi:hypothetical protein